MHSTKSKTLIHLDFPRNNVPLENPFLVQGWIISHSEIQAVWIPFESEIPLTFIERPDVINAYPSYPHVKGFTAKVDREIIKNNTLNIHYRLDNGEFSHSWCLTTVHRQSGYNLLTGHGLEIGAFHQPAIIPAHCTIEYCDAQSKEDIIQYFPEININELVEVNHVCDLDQEGLSLFEAEHFDFVILNHVIEHVANPINVVKELFRVIKHDGYVVISAPDKNFTFDRHRALTSFAHLQEEYENNVTVVTDAHYIDFLQGVHPEINLINQEELKLHINNVRKRREHAHVWDSLTFSDFMLKALDLLQLKASCEFVNLGNDNQFEYFSVWKKIT